MKLTYSYFAGNAMRIHMLDSVIRYVSAALIDDDLYKRIQVIYQDLYGKNPLHKSRDYISQNLYYEYYWKYEWKDNEELHQGGLDIAVINRCFDILVDNNVIIKHPYAMLPGEEREQEYIINSIFLRYLLSNDLIFCHLFGLKYVVKHFQNSVVKIEVKSKGGVSIGTGWVLRIDNYKSSEWFVITNEHVIDGADSFCVLSKDEKRISHYAVETFIKSDGCDMAIIKIDANELSCPSFTLAKDIDLLDGVVTIGYPAIPLSREAYQVVHRGEVNSYVKDYSNQDLLIISARTSPGQSGSPVIDEMGQVVGMVTSLLYERTAFMEQGISPYYACIPSTTILQMLIKSRLLNSQLYDNE